MLQLLAKSTKSRYGANLPSCRTTYGSSLAGEKVTADDLELHQFHQIVSLEVTSTPICDSTGAVKYAIAVFQDITVRKKAELVAQLIEEIPASHALELMALRDWVNKFQFEKILDLT